MPKRIDKLTDEQKSQIDAWADKWIEIGLRTGEIDLQTFTEGAKEAYGFASIPWHNNVIVVDNPLIMALAAPVAGLILNNIAIVGDAVGDTVVGAVDDAVSNAVNGAVCGAVYDAVVGAVGDVVGDVIGNAVSDVIGNAVDDAVVSAVVSAVGGAVGGAVDGAIGNAVDVAVGDAVGGAVRGAVGGAVDDAVAGAVGDAVNVAVSNLSVDSVRKAILDNYRKYLGGQFWVGGWYWGNAYVTFFRDVCDLELSQDILGRMKAYEKINTSACV